MLLITTNQSAVFYLTRSDVEGYYYRIIHTAADIALFRVGISKTKIHSMFSSIKRMIHRIRTSFGDSEISYGRMVLDTRKIIHRVYCKVIPVAQLSGPY